MKARVVVAVVAVAVLLTGCQKVVRHPTVEVSPCFRILPQARTAVGGQGSYVGVTRFRGEAVDDFYLKALGFVPEPSTTLVPTTVASASASGAASGATSTTSPDERRDICVVVYKGTFDAAKVEHLIGGRTGKYALVIVGVRRLLVRAVVLRDQLPAGLHAH